MPTTVTYVVDTGGTGDYTSLAAWEAAQQQDLVTNDRLMEVQVKASGGAADTTACTISGWTTDATRYIWIHPAPGQEHGGKWDDSKHRMVTSVNTLTVSGGVTVKLFGLQLRGTNTGNYGGAHCNDGNIGMSVEFNGCIVRSNGYQAIAVSRFAFGLFAVRNCLLLMEGTNGLRGSIRFDSAGHTGTPMYGENNTCVNLNPSNTQPGLLRLAGNAVARNNIVVGFADAYSGTFASGTDYNATDSSDNIGTGSNNLVNQSFPFADAAGGDYSLTSQLAGQNLSSDFTTDILGKMRLNWTRGAFEFYSQQSSQPVWFM